MKQENQKQKLHWAQKYIFTASGSITTQSLKRKKTIESQKRQITFMSFLLILWNIPFGPGSYCTPRSGSTAHPAFSGFLCSDSGLTVSPHTKPGLLFNEAGPQGEKNNYLFRHRGEESLTPPHLFHVRIYSWVTEGRFSACFGDFLTVLCSERHSPSAWTGHKCLWHHRLGGRRHDLIIRFLSVFQHIF